MRAIDPRERHAQRRAAERMGVKLTAPVKQAIIREIKRATRWAKTHRDGGHIKAWLIRPDSYGAQIWRVRLEDQDWRVVYSPRTRCIVTVLPSLPGPKPAPELLRPA